MNPKFSLNPDEYLKSGNFLSTTFGKIFIYKRNSKFGSNVTNSQSHPKESVKILFLHGFPTSSYDFLPLMDELERNYPSLSFQFLAFDFLGLGYSDKPKEFYYSISTQTNIMEMVLEENKFNHFHIVTHDYGVTVAQEFLARYNEELSSYQKKYSLQKVLFLNGGLFPETHRARIIQKIMASSFAPLVMPFFKKNQFAKSFSAVFGTSTQPSKEELDGFWKIIKYNNGDKMIHKLLSYISQRKKNRNRWVSAILDPPSSIRLVNGNQDPVSGRHMVKRYEELTGRLDTIHLTKIGHYPQVEDVESVAEAVGDFFALPTSSTTSTG